MEALLNETQVSETLQVSLASLRRWRVLGQGPRYVKVGGLVRYRPEAINQWVEGLPQGGSGVRRSVSTNPRRRLAVPA
jgi:predicted DNA-binding transcriptional regulator AlpA